MLSPFWRGFLPFVSGRFDDAKEDGILLGLLFSALGRLDVIEGDAPFSPTAALRRLRAAVALGDSTGDAFADVVRESSLFLTMPFDFSLLVSGVPLSAAGGLEGVKTKSFLLSPFASCASPLECDVPSPAVDAFERLGAVIFGSTSRP
jgi:hypothetical protein